MTLSTKRQENIGRSAETRTDIGFDGAFRRIQLGEFVPVHVLVPVLDRCPDTHGSKAHGDSPRPGAFAFPVWCCPVPGRGSRRLSSFPPSPPKDQRKGARARTHRRAKISSWFRLCRVRVSGVGCRGDTWVAPSLGALIDGPPGAIPSGTDPGRSERAAPHRPFPLPYSPLPIPHSPFPTIPYPLLLRNLPQPPSGERFSGSGCTRRPTEDRNGNSTPGQKGVGGRIRSTHGSWCRRCPHGPSPGDLVAPPPRTRKAPRAVIHPGLLAP